MSRRNVRWVDEAILTQDLTGKTYIVTGANSGVGLETTRQLIKQGAHVIMGCRRVDAAEAVAKDFAELEGSYDIIRIDLADLKSVREFVTEFLDKYDRLDGLACNAGMANMTGELSRTKDGLELTTGISYFGHFLLTELLLDTLKASAPSRIILVSSVVHAGSEGNRPKVHLDDLKYENREPSNMQIYAEAKVANILYAKELAERLEGTGVTTASVHPGWARSNFGSGGGPAMRAAMVLMKPILPFVSNSNEESAQTTLYCLLSDDAPNHNGSYFSQQSVLYRDQEYRDGGWPMETPNPNARNMETARELVDMSYGIVQLERER